MSYCVAVALNKGLVFASDSRTNAGLDQISTYRKMHPFVWEGERVFVLLSAGNLATTQAVVRQLELDIHSEAHPINLRDVTYISEAAAYIGKLSRQIQNSAQGLNQGDFNPAATFILGGQIGAQAPELYLIYPEGNFISVSPEHPFLQIGETKYGKPILDRIIAVSTSLEDAARCALVSLDSTMRSNLTVGPPVDVLLYTRDHLKVTCHVRFGPDHPYLLALHEQWNQELKQAFIAMPSFDWTGCAGNG